MVSFTFIISLYFEQSNSEVGEELSGAIDVDSAGELEGPDRKSDDVDDGELLSSLYRPGKRRKAGESVLGHNVILIPSRSDLLSQQNGGEEGQSEAIGITFLHLLPPSIPLIIFQLGPYFMSLVSCCRTCCLTLVPCSR